MACGEFVIPRIKKTCACCGMVIVRMQAKEYRRVHFLLQPLNAPDPVSTFVSFCTGCASHDWQGPPLRALERQSHWMLANEGSDLIRWHGPMLQGATFLGLDPACAVQRWEEVE